MTALPSPAPELPARARKRLGALGHHLASFAEALAMLRARCEKGRLPEPLAAHARLCLAGLPVSELTEAFEVALDVPADAPEEWTVALDEALPAASARACALLHLPGLRRTWGGWLRGSLFQELQTRLPRAWVVDHATIPPHGAIAGLGIADWSGLWRLRADGRTFRVRFQDDVSAVELTDAQSREDWEHTAQRLAAAPPGGAVVTELPKAPCRRWQARFTRREGRWEMEDLAAGAGGPG